MGQELQGPWEPRGTSETCKGPRKIRVCCCSYLTKLLELKRASTVKKPKEFLWVAKGSFGDKMILLRQKGPSEKRPFWVQRRPQRTKRGWLMDEKIICVLAVGPLCQHIFLLFHFFLFFPFLFFAFYFYFFAFLLFIFPRALRTQRGGHVPSVPPPPGCATAT